MKTVTRGRAIKFKCAECMGFYTDGKKDCEIANCPLYTWMPFRKSKPILWWLNASLAKLKDAYIAWRGYP